ncbi:PREDICTED: uncharacterized protein LOC109181976 isoform X2 [Ipomoea nil]|uniref:uncharacterized protein LOC109181976 isoform X2 n=1 Tax=Ipomoea nil TaxID=35883 RepID=UPI00090135A3|nr:PREDICTED: uncharacterized protein LOC109181976 isoform X2 [Ipomoea nil]
MDVCAFRNKLVSENVSHFGLLPGKLPDFADNSATDFDVNDLGNHFSKFVIIQEDQELSDTTAHNLSKDDGYENTSDSHSSSLASKKCLVKSATFPFSSKSVSPNDLIQRENEQMNDATSAQPPSRTKSLPSARKLVSAMKGSREKQGIPPMKLGVKWAPDVYDPVPTSVSHAPVNKPQQRHRSDGKKNGKYKQKNSGKSSRANKGKDKKQGRKYGGSSKRGFYPLDDNSIVVSSCELQTGIVDLDINSPDPFCGSSFLKNSVTKLHFPVAEAT